MINLRQSRPRVASVNLAPDEQQEQAKRRSVWIPVVVLVVLIGVVTGYFLAMSSRGPAGKGADASGLVVAVGGRFAQRFADLLESSDIAGLAAGGPLPDAGEGGRWDPFAPLVELAPVVKPISPAEPSGGEAAAAEAEPKPAPPPPPEPPAVALTGVLRSGERAVAILSVAGRTQLARVGESPFEGAVVRSIGDRSLVVSFFGNDIHYSLGGEQQ